MSLGTRASCYISIYTWLPGLGALVALTSSPMGGLGLWGTRSEGHGPLGANVPSRPWLLDDFWETEGDRGYPNGRFWRPFSSILGAFRRSGHIVKIELSRESELNPGGCGGSGIRQISVCFSRPTRDRPHRHSRRAFWYTCCEKVFGSDPQWAPKSGYNLPKVVAGIHLASMETSDPPRGPPGAPKGTKSDRF